jgi:hypothetical protein
MSLFSPLYSVFEPTKDNIFTKIRGFIEYRYWDLRMIYFGVKRVIKWLPIIYKSAPWDYGHLLNIMSFQFKQMKEYHLEDENRFVGQKHVIKQLAEAEELTKRLAESQFLSKEWDEHYKKYPPGWALGEELQKALNLPIITLPDEVAKEAWREHKVLCEREKYLEKQYMERYCYLLTHKMKTWWY